MNRKRLVALARYCYLIVLAAFVVRAISTRRSEIVDLLEGTRVLVLLGVLLLSFAMLGIASLFWRTALKLMGYHTPYVRVLMATARSVMARYIPGSIWYAVGRVALLQRSGIPTLPLTITAALEVLLSLAIALAGGSAVLAAIGDLPGGLTWVALAVPTLVFVTSPPVVRRLVRRLSGPQADRLALSWGGYGWLLAIMGGFWLWSAAVFTLYLRAFPANDALGTAQVVGGFLLAWGVGFLAFIAPQGVGIFELTLATLLVSQGVAEVAVVIGGYRIIVLLRDAIAATIAEVLAWRARKLAPGMGEHSSLGQR